MRDEEDSNLLGPIASAVVFVFVIIAYFGAGLIADNPSKAKAAVENAGYVNVKVTNDHWAFVGLSGCDSNDFAGYDVEADNAQGRHVRLTVCNGIIKAFTVRIK